jgi:hypothetical protein
MDAGFAMSEQIYCAIIGDIDRSRELADRGKVQERLENALGAVNDEFERVIASKFLITLGDEFQGILNSPGESLRIIRRLQSAMNPVVISFGVGVGTLETALKPVALGIDGIAFHRSRDALSTAKAKGGARIVYSFDGPGVKLVNFLVFFADRRLKKISQTTIEVHRLMKTNKSQADVAKLLGMTQQGVSRALRSSAYHEVKEIEESLGEFLQSLPDAQKSNLLVNIVRK